MKTIATNLHTGLRWRRIAVVVFAFGLGISVIGLSAFKWIDDALLDIVPKKNFVYAVFVGALGLAIFWSLVIALFASFFEWVLNRQVVWGWPRYFFYAFRFSDGKPIVGWTRINLNPTEGTLHAIGRSFQADAALIQAECVPWISQIVSGGTSRGIATCYILYSLDERAAEKSKRPYKDGLLRFRLLQRHDLREDAVWPDPSHLGEEQYIGDQQAIDKDGVWNRAYAESAAVEGETDAEITKSLTHELGVRRESLLAALDKLERGVRITNL